MGKVKKNSSPNLPSIVEHTNSTAEDNDSSSGTQVLTRPKVRTKKPPMYKVVLLNDDFTPMDFVVLVLRKFFNLSDTDANRVMLEVHHQGAGVAGIFSHELAETKVYLVNDFSKKNQHPLKCIMEKN